MAQNSSGRNEVPLDEADDAILQADVTVRFVVGEQKP